MEATHINVKEIKVGQTIADHIFANTQYPIIYKDTKITYEHIHLLNVFNIKAIPIYQQLAGSNKTVDVVESKPVQHIEQAVSFEKSYASAIQQFKKEFFNWESGAKIDMTKIRGMAIPLIEQVLENRSYIFDLNSYSNPQDYLYHHCIATGLISSIMAQKLGYEKGICIQMAIAGALADSGMAKIPAKIRDKTSKLTAQEFAEIRQHPVHSYVMVKDLAALKSEMKKAIFQHHERLNGSGYPKGIKSEDILIFSQIIAVADVYHAMTSERLYSEQKATFQVIEMIKESEFGKFDIKVVNALIAIVADLPIGTKVELSNKERAEVMFINKYAPTRPLVKITRTGEIIDLATVRSFYISRVITKSDD
ncbi:HD-GYP domain-containing protein [Metasolibacillus sp. FSL H7-0170]|uniref:HD-GYP domain-containing protein n=1 Tax=Metasolibacillus TaxID=2703677 RepID=UPI00079BA443|nr:HD-GYP domain-containing protein [Metasolibacillus fluoroglycofenilyticus]KYG89801.1 c-di-GMP phosphodiesterase [[Bacillus] sp. KCTC 13219]